MCAVSLQHSICVDRGTQDTLIQIYLPVSCSSHVFLNNQNLLNNITSQQGFFLLSVTLLDVTRLWKNTNRTILEKVLHCHKHLYILSTSHLSNSSFTVQIRLWKNSLALHQHFYSLAQGNHLKTIFLPKPGELYVRMSNKLLLIVCTSFIYMWVAL